MQFAAILGVIAASALIGFVGSSTMITPVSLLWLVPVTLAGVVLAFPLGTILWRLNREYRPAGIDKVYAIGLAAIISGLTFHMMAWRLAEQVSFARGATATTASYPILRVTQDKHRRNHWAMINPFELYFRGMIVPISRDQYQRLIQGCGGGENDCSGADLCITVPIERAPDGAIRVMTTEISYPPKSRPVGPCTPAQSAVKSSPTSAAGAD